MRRPQVLVVDDDAEIQGVLLLLLREEGYDVLSAGNGVEALKILDTVLPSLILLDVNMPGMDGIETCRQIKARPDLALIPIIFLSARGTVADRITGLQESVNDYVAKPFNPRELQLRVANLLRQNEEFKKVFMTDMLTGLNNYNFFREQFSHQFHIARRYKKSFSLVIADVDGFKRINDMHGHLCGDAVLKEVARFLKQEARNSDFVVRYGGDEFALILPETDRAAVEKLIGRIRRKLPDVRVPCAGEQLRVGLSFGAAMYDQEMQNEQELFQRADDNMYREKGSKTKGAD